MSSERSTASGKTRLMTPQERAAIIQRTPWPTSEEMEASVRRSREARLADVVKAGRLDQELERAVKARLDNWRHGSRGPIPATKTRWEKTLEAERARLAQPQPENCKEDPAEPAVQGKELQKLGKRGNAPRAVISWFGWKIEDLELISEETCREWMHRVQAMAEARGWVVERPGNNIDLIIGRSGRSIVPIEFFDFQRDWERLNEEFEFRFSGILWLMGEHHETLGDDAPHEVYIGGQKQYGDSSGRPQRHRIQPG